MLNLYNLQLYLLLNCGADTVVVTSSTKYNDAQWHNVTISRDSTDRCKLSADNQFVDEAIGMCSETMTLHPPFYYGGLYQLTDQIKRNLRVSTDI